MRSLIMSSAIAAAALSGAPLSAMAQQNDPYCLLSSESGSLNCAYQTMSQCEQSRQGPTDTCTTNPAYGTIGLGRVPPSQQVAPGEGLPPRNPNATR